MAYFRCVVLVLLSCGLFNNNNNNNNNSLHLYSAFLLFQALKALNIVRESLLNHHQCGHTSTPLLFSKDILGFLMTTESQDLGLMSHLKDVLLYIILLYCGLFPLRCRDFVVLCTTGPP